MDQDMTPAAFEALRDAVNLAKERQVRSIEPLLRMVVAAGHTEGDARIALAFWGTYEQQKTARQKARRVNEEAS